VTAPDGPNPPGTKGQETFCTGTELATVDAAIDTLGRLRRDANTGGTQ
jgi:hypothetical protein